MRFGITVLTNPQGELSIYPGAGAVTLPLMDIDIQKALIKTAAVKGLTIGGKHYVGGMLVSQHGLEMRKNFPTEAQRKAKAHVEAAPKTAAK